MTLTGMIILSNNKLVVEKYEQVAQVTGCLLDVLRTARDYIHQGHQLLTHPLAGSIKPNETPYKTVIITQKANENIDFESLSVIENAIEVSVRLLREKPRPKWSERVLLDFQIIDKSLIDSAMANLKVF